MKLLFDLFPVILFFAAFKISHNNIFVATAVAIVASTIQIAWTYIKRRKLEPMHLVSFLIILVFGGATLLLKNETFIKWKPTVLYSAFALALFVSNAFLKKNLIQTLMQKELTLPPPSWRMLNWLWIGFFIFVAGLNLVVAYSFPTDIWVNFKLFGIMGLLLVFIMIQGVILSRNRESGAASRE